MFQKEIRFSLSLIFLLLLSCNENKKAESVDFATKDRYLHDKFQNYSSLYTCANDSINTWLNDSLAVVKPYFFYSWKLDSLFIFNSDSNMFFSSVNLADNRNRNAIADDISSFAGRKINGKWYFFFGASTILQREYYQYSKYSPLSFEEMSYLTYEQNFSCSIENNKPLPEEAMDDFFGGGMVNYLGIKGRNNINRYIDSMALVTNASYHAKKMTKEEIAEIQKAIDESVRPPEPQKEIKQWWQFWKDEPQTPIFETEEWKNYLKQKYGSKWQEQL